MPTFQALPTDILLLILHFIPHDALPRLGLTSKILNRLTTPQTYRYIHYHDPWNALRYPSWQSKHPQVCGYHRDHHRRDTRIYSLTRLLRTVSESETLRRLVKGASFHCNTNEGDELAANITGLLVDSESLRNGHFAPFEMLGSSSVMPVLNFVTSLEIRFDHLDPVPDSDAVPMERLYQIFSLPDLRSLSIILVRSWTPGDPRDTTAKSQVSKMRKKTSNITCLSLFATIPPGPDLEDMLSWPIALQSLHYELCTDEHNSFGLSLPTLSPLEFSSALESQMTSLEELVIYGDCQGDNTGYMANELIDLRSFSALRIVGLDLAWLMVSKLIAECYDAESSEILKMGEVLPLGLEMLQVQMDDYAFEEWFADGPPREVGVGGGEVSDALLGLVRRDDGSSSTLERILLWRPNYCATAEVDLAEIKGCDQLLAAATGAEVEVSGWVGLELPFLR